MRVRNQRPGRPAPTGGATGHSGTGMGIYNRKQESKKKKHALDQESDQEKKVRLRKRRYWSRKYSRKRPRNRSRKK